MLLPKNNYFKSFILALICFIFIVILSCQNKPENIPVAEPIASDKNVYKFTGDFDGNGYTDLAFWNSKDSSIWFGLYNGNTLNWVKVYENQEWEIVPKESGIFKFTGDYIDPSDNKVKTYFGFWYYGDGNIWIAKYNGETLIWNMVSIMKYYEN